MNNLQDAILNVVPQLDKTTYPSNKAQVVFEAFAWQWPYFVFTVVSLLVTTLILTFLIYKPIKKALKRRQDYIQQNIDDSVKAKEQALELKAQANDSLIATNREADKLIHQAKVESEKIVDNYTNTAKTKAHSIIEQANTSISKSWRDFEKEQKKIIVENAVEIAKKIIGREIKDSENKKMIKQLLDEAK